MRERWPRLSRLSGRRERSGPRCAWRETWQTSGARWPYWPMPCSRHNGLRGSKSRLLAPGHQIEQVLVLVPLYGGPQLTALSLKFSQLRGCEAGAPRLRDLPAQRRQLRFQVPNLRHRLPAALPLSRTTSNLHSVKNRCEVVHVEAKEPPTHGLGYPARPC